MTQFPIGDAGVWLLVYYLKYVRITSRIGNGVVIDTPRTVFSNNLRIHSKRFPSIAHICRGVPINRQQFNKYLLGSNLPTPRVRQKLCQFLGVSEDEMFSFSDTNAQPDFTQTRPNSLSDFQLKQIFTKEFVRDIQDQAPILGKSILHSGFYYCYFQLQNFPDFLVRSLMRITLGKNGGTFVRHTYFRSTAYPPKVISRGRHRGIVFESAQEISFFGFSTSTPHHFSLLTFDRQKENDDDILLGVGLTKGSSKSFASKVCLEFIGKGPAAIKDKVELIGVVGWDDPSIHPIISVAMSQNSLQVQGQVNILDYERLMARERRKPAQRVEDQIA